MGYNDPILKSPRTVKATRSYEEYHFHKESQSPTRMSAEAYLALANIDVLTVDLDSHYLLMNQNMARMSSSIPIKPPILLVDRDTNRVVGYDPDISVVYAAKHLKSSMPVIFFYVQKTNNEWHPSTISLYPVKPRDVSVPPIWIDIPGRSPDAR